MSGALKILSLLALVVGALAVAGCGGGDEREERNAYVRQLNAAQQEFADNASLVSQERAPASIAQYRRTLERFEATIASFTAKLQKIEVPDEVRDEHARLIDALKSFGQDFNRVTAALKNPNARKLSEAKRAISIATNRANLRIEAAAAAIDSKLERG